MRRVLLFILMAPVITCFGQNKWAPIPALKYAEILGYQTQIDSTTNELLVILPNGIKEKARDFYNGKVGKEFSYCAKYGYDLQIKKNKRGKRKYQYKICVDKDNGIRKRMETLMFEKGDYEELFVGIAPPPPGDTIPPEDTTLIEPPPPEDPPGGELFFSWKNSMPPAPYQGNSYACSAFASIAIAEWAIITNLIN